MEPDSAAAESEPIVMVRQLLADAGAVDLGSLTLEDMRGRREDLQAVETTLSFYRRVAQAWLDIAHAELERRVAGGGKDPGEGLGSLVERLPEILTRQPKSDVPHPRVMPTTGARDAPALVGKLEASLESLIGSHVLAVLPELDDADARRLADRLAAFEHELSAVRRACHEGIDRVQEEIVARYRRGEASSDELLR